MARKKLAPRRVIEKQRHATAVTKAPATLNQATQPPTQIFTAPDGVRAEVLQLGVTGTPRKSHTHVVVLPGNPGIVEYYRPMLRALWHRLPADVKERVSLHAVGYPGHDVRQLNGLQTFNIADHTNFLKSFVNELKPALPHSEIVFMGHSYGSFLALRVAEELGKNIERVSLVMLMPALWQMGSCAGIVSRVLLRDTLGSTTWIAWALTAFLPPVVRDALLSVTPYRSDIGDVTRTLINGRQRGLYLNICALARDEVANILEPSSMPAIPKVADRSLLVYANSDKWCPPEGRQRIEKAFGDGLQVERAGDGVSHGFVMYEDQTEKAVKVISPWLCERIRRTEQKVLSNI